MNVARFPALPVVVPSSARRLLVVAGLGLPLAAVAADPTPQRHRLPDSGTGMVELDRHLGRDVPAVNYGFLLPGDLDRPRVATALADMVALPPASVDIGDDGQDDRNWDAAVSCTITHLNGDLHWYLDIYLVSAVRNPPTPPAAAVWLAARLDTVVAYEAAPFRPSAYWLVAADGTRTRARIYEEDTDELPVYRIDAVEHPLAALPGLPVAPLPEVIRDHRMPTPISDRLREQLPTSSEADLLSRLGAWESMVTRLTDGWPPDGWYPAAYYREDLETRDALAAAAPPIAQALAEIDQRFTDATHDDNGQALSAATGPLLPAAGPWWWRRIPRPLPWQNAPGPAQQ